VQNSMKILTLDAIWEPRPGYSITAAEAKTRKAVNASQVLKEPKLVIGESPIPRIAEDEVLIKVKACGICGSDTHCYEKNDQGYMLYSGSVRPPVIIGHEFSGEVVEAGGKVIDLKIGDAVAPEGVLYCGLCTECRTGHPNQCQRLEMIGFSAPGAFAEYVAVKEKYCWKLDVLRSLYPSDDNLYEVGALIEPIGCAYNGMFIAGGGFHPGAYVAVYGAGPIGLGAVLMARLAGAAKIFAFDLSEPRNRLALELGADFAASPDDLKEKGTSPGEIVREMTGGHGADMQIEAAGAALETIPEIEKSFASNGKMIHLGRQETHAPMEFNTIVSGANRVIGARGHAGYGIFPNVIRLIAAGRLPAHNVITSRFPFDRVLDAFKQSTARTDGKIMVRFP